MIREMFAMKSYNLSFVARLNVSNGNRHEFSAQTWDFKKNVYRGYFLFFLFFFLTFWKASRPVTPTQEEIPMATASPQPKKMDMSEPNKNSLRVACAMTPMPITWNKYHHNHQSINQWSSSSSPPLLLKAMQLAVRRTKHTGMLFLSHAHT